MGAFGYFPTYAIGNLMASQFFAAARGDIADLDSQIARGEFAPLVDWLRDRIHRHGRMRTARQLLVDVTGRGLTAAPWLDYIREKYSDLYETDLTRLT